MLSTNIILNNNINSDTMGSQHSPQKPKPTLQDALIEMRINSKKIQRQSTKSMNQSQKFMQKAKQALRKNDEQEAKLFLQTAAQKRSESINLRRMALRMDYIGSNMKNMESNEQIMKSFQTMANLTNYNQGMNFEQMAGSMQKMDAVMDEMMINGKMMEEVMSHDTVADSTADSMLDIIKNQIAMQKTNQIDQAALIQQRERQFQNQLKKL